MTPSMDLRDIREQVTPTAPRFRIANILWVLEAFLQDGGRVLCLRNPVKSECKVGNFVFICGAKQIAQLFSLLSSNEDEFLIEHWRVGLRGYQRFANRGKALDVLSSAF